MVEQIKLLSTLLVMATCVVSVDSRCNPFKQARRKSTNPLFGFSNSKRNNNVINGHYYSMLFHEQFPLHHPHKQPRTAFLHRLLIVRGGESIDENDIAADDDEIPMTHFISSFESELAEIRREAEMEAENEMQKLRGMLEESQDEFYYDEDGEEEEAVNVGEWEGEAGTGYEEEEEVYDVIVDEDEDAMQYQSDNEDLERYDYNMQQTENQSDGGNDEVEEEENENEQYEEDAPTSIEADEIEGSEEIEDEVTDEGEIIQLDDDEELKSPNEPVDKEILDEKKVGTEAEQDDESSEHEIPVAVDDNNEEVDTKEEIFAGTEDIPSHKKAKKSKSSKKGGSNNKKKEKSIPASKKTKAKSNKSKAKKTTTKEVESLESIIGRNDIIPKGSAVQESVAVTITPNEYELEENRSRGIIGLLRSDLARALVLFIATVIVSVWMQKLQRQLEAQGN